MTIAYDHGADKVLIHSSVRARWEADPGNRLGNWREYVEAKGWTRLVP